MNIWVYFEIERGAVSPTSLESISLAKRLGTVSVVILHPQAKTIADQAFKLGVSTAFINNSADLEEFSPELFSSTISKAAKAEKPDAIILPSTFQSRELTGMLSIDLECDVLNDALSISQEDDNVIATRPIYEGKVIEKIRANSTMKLISVRGRMFPVPNEEPVSDPKTVEIELSGSRRSNVIDRRQTSRGISLANAPVVVSVGRGITNHPAFGLSEVETAAKGIEQASELAGLLNGAVGASRVIVDAGYLPYDHQVGQTGKVISPDLYFGLGISGSIQHMVGMRGAKLVVVINKDPEAPLFQNADYGIIGDLYDYLPHIIEGFREVL